MSEIDTRGLDGSNPLGFLAALGTLRLLESEQSRPRLAWHRAYGTWTARIYTEAGSDEGALAEHLAESLRSSADHPALSRWDDLSVHPEDFRDFMAAAAQSASLEDREWADFGAAFGCESTVRTDASRLTIQDTAFRTMSGAGHQHFLKTMRHVLATVTAAHVEKTLFGPWTYDDPLEKSTLRWDPKDDVRYALRWRNPSGDPERKRRGSMLGANALAIHALPFFSTAPIGSSLSTTGFSRRARRVTWTWPIWETPIPVAVVRSLLALPELRELLPSRHEEVTQHYRRIRDELTRRGIVEIYQSRRVTTGKFRNFTPAEPV